MTTPDRTDGDGLKACPICNGPGEASTAMARKAWNTRTAPQAPDTREGTEPVAWRWKYDSDENWSLCTRKRSFFGDRDVIFEPLYAAPPKPAPDQADDFGDMPSAYLAARSSLAKPAPDALREALDREEKYLVDSVTADCDIMPGDVQGSFHRLRSLLSPQSTGDQPQVKPDREALIHTICPHIRQYSDSHWQGNHACLQCPATVKISQGDAVQRCRRDAEAAADDIIRCWQSTGDQPTPQVNGASTPSVASHDREHSVSRGLDELGYRMCWHPGWLAGLWARVWYRYRCPYPITKDHSARACVRSGYCGCDNGPRLSHLLQERGTPS